MNKLSHKYQPLSLSVAARSDLEPARRLIVLVPGIEADLTAATHRIWELANATGCHVKFLALCNDEVQELGLRRRLITMSALANYGSVSAESEVMIGGDWVDAVKSRWQAGDMVVCFAEQRTGLLRKPLSQVLHSDLDIPLYILSGLTPQEYSRTNGPVHATAWIGFIIIMLVFLILQVKIYQLTTYWTTVLELFSTAAELWLLWVWNNLFR